MHVSCILVPSRPYFELYKLDSNKIWYYATFNWYATFFDVYYLISTSHPKIDFVMCNLLQNSRWIKYWLFSLNQSDYRIFNQIIMTIAIWFAQKDTSNKFPDFNLSTYLQLGCWSIHCIWYSNSVRNHGYTSVYYTSYHKQDFTMSHYDIKDRQQITANEWHIVGKIYTGCMQKTTALHILFCHVAIA